jgi:protein-disulfide isomerase-like protein with CxxC motif
MSADDCVDSGYLPDPNTRYGTAQTLQPGDNTLTCAQLRVLTSAFQENVAAMDKSIQQLTGQAQTHSQMAQAAGVVAPAATAAAAGMQMMSSSDSQKAVNLQQIRDSHQKRHDFLMQIYFQKHCDD